ncbi:helix-turn-helix transcriptional regulator [Enterococcus moraviensis]|nr:DNA-binding protein [Enterococcus moraviensis]
MSQADLANRVGVVKQTIINLEKNKHNPSLMLMYAISKELETTIEELVTFERIKNE